MVPCGEIKKSKIDKKELGLEEVPFFVLIPSWEYLFDQLAI
jgi:hypothetical protein